MKILAFAGSNSETSINKKFVTYAASFFDNHDVEIIDLNDYEMPIYSSQREKTSGVPQLALDFAEKVDGADLLLISLADHNGSYTAAFKNVFDWISRVPGRKAFGDKEIFALSTSPGAGAGKAVMNAFTTRAPYSGGIVIESYSLPSFGQTFSDENGIVDEDLKKDFVEKVEKVKCKFETLA